MSVLARVRGAVGSLLPPPVRVRLRHPFMGQPVGYLRAHRRARVYATHYSTCRRVFAGSAPTTLPPLREFTWLPLAPSGTEGHPVRLPPNYDAILGRITRDVQERLSWTAHSWLHPPIARLPPRTEETPEVRRGDVIIQKLTDPLPIDGLNELCDALVPSLEQELFRSHVKVDSVQVSRTYASAKTAGGSFLWHHDEFPREILKLLIYLTDVNEDTAPLTYLEGPDGQPVVGSPLPMFGASRISEERMRDYFALGCRVRQLVGPRGTAVLFSPAIVHRATIAARGHRDALFLTLRPSRTRYSPHVHPRWTATVRHDDFSPNPEADLPPLDARE